MLRSFQRTYLRPKLYSLCATFATGTDSDVSASTSKVPKSNLIFDAPAGSNISHIIKTNGVFVDKTSSAYKILTTGKNLLRFQGPKRLGKSTIFRMIEDLCRGDAEAIFEKTFISSNDFFTKHWKKVLLRDSKEPVYPVECLSFTFKYLPQTTEELKKQLLSMIKKQGNRVNVPVELDRGVAGAMESLLDGIEKKGKQAIALIDEVDSPFNNADVKAKREKRNLFDGFFACLKDNLNIRLMLLASTMDRHSLLGDGANDTEDITTYHRASPDLGFTQDDVSALFPDAYLAECGITEENKAKFFADLKLYYNGYRLRGDSEETVYSPYSILQCRKHKCQIDTYWADEVTTTEMESFVPQFPLLISQETRIHLDKSNANVNGLTLSEQAMEAVRMLWNYGIFTIAGNKDGVYDLKPSNQEVINIYRRMVELGVWQTTEKMALFTTVVRHAEKRELLELGKTLTLLFKRGSMNFEVESDIETVLCSGLDRAAEAFQGNAKRQVSLGFAEKTAGKADVVLTLPDSAYVFEIKLGSKYIADDAMKQIKKKKYCEKLAKNLARRVYAVALHYSHLEGTSLQIAEVKPIKSGKAQYLQKFAC